MPETSELSEREREILRLVATGASNKEIALKLVISPNTVKVHLRNIFAKIGAASRTEATLYALRTGLISPPGSVAPAEIPDAPLTEPQPTPTKPVPLAVNRWRRFWPYAILLGMLALFMLLGSWLTRPAANPDSSGVVTPPPRWSARSDLPLAASYPAGAVYENSIYLIGGETAQGVSAQVWRYDPASDAWQPRAEKPTPVSRAHAVLLGEKIYVPGGQAADGFPTSQLEIYDPRLDSWEQGAPLPAALAGYALAGLEGQLFLFGGWDGKTASARVYSYNPLSDAWESRSNLPGARMDAAAVTPSGKIVVVGGRDDQQALASVDVYYPQRDQPGQNPWESRPPLPQPRYGMAAAAITEIIYMTGGADSSGEPPPPLFSSSTENNTWSSMEAPPHAAGEGALLLPVGTRLYLMGGRVGAEHSTLLQAYQAIYTVVFPVIR